MPQTQLPDTIAERSSGAVDQAEVRRERLGTALLLVGDNDRAAFRTVYTLTCDRLFGICLRICRERATAEDVLADVYLTVWKRAGAWDPARGSAITWLATIARNRAIDCHRARAVRGVEVPSDTCDVPDEDPDPEAILLSKDRDQHVARCLDKLAPHQATAIRAAFFDGFTYEQLASRSGVPVGTMKSWVRRGLAQMRRKIEDDEQAVPADPVGYYGFLQPALTS